MAPSSKKQYVHPTHVVALYDYTPTNSKDSEDSNGLPKIEFIPDHVEDQQLTLQRGQVFQVISETLDWWILCEAKQDGRKGYVPTVFCAPLHIG